MEEVGLCGFEGYILLYEFFVAFGHLSINAKVNLSLKKHGRSYRLELVKD